jgi:ABC-type multidrug transport system fused ATPase/permease subunit
MKALHLPHVPAPKVVLSVTSLLRPHWKAMTMAMVGVAGIAATELLEPWPLKIVIDHLLQDRPLDGWMGAAAGWLGAGPLAVLNLAVAAVAGHA